MVMLVCDSNKLYKYNIIEIDLCNENVYTYQIKAVTKNILENKKKPSFPGVTSSESLENMRILDNWLN